MNTGFSYPHSLLQSPADFGNDTGLYTFETLSPHLSQLGPIDNALGLDIQAGSETLSPHVYPSDMFYHDLSSMGSPFARQQLPQIITDGLETVAMTYPPAPSREHSPYHLSAGSSTGGHPPLSAATSTPSSAGYNTIPMTPGSLPPSHLVLPPASSLLSPNSPYAHYSHFPSHVSQKSPPALPHVSSPSPSPSRADYSDEDGNGTHNPTPLPITYQTVLELASRYVKPEWIIPQKIYRPNTQSDRRRYVEEVALEQPIMFFMQQPEGCGISCRDALTSKFANLVGRDDAMFKQRGPSVSIRINVRSVPQSFLLSARSSCLSFSGLAMHLGADKSRRGISVARLSQSLALSWRRTWPRPFSASST